MRTSKKHFRLMQHQSVIRDQVVIVEPGPVDFIP